MNGRINAQSLRDGASNTLCMAEVKAWQQVYLDAGNAPMAVPRSPKVICRLGGLATPTGQLLLPEGHGIWVSGRVHQTGFTSAFRPNTIVRCNRYDVDWTSQQEGTSLTVPTYAAVTSRSFHAGGVCMALMDGSARFTSDNVESSVWRAMSTIAGGDETNPPDAD